MASFGAADWRADYRRSFPRAVDWITDGSLVIESAGRTHRRADAADLGRRRTPISPVAVGRHLEQRIPDARLHVVPGGDHDLAKTHAELVAPLIEAHLTA